MSARKKNHMRRIIRIIFMAVAIVTFWWGVWGLLDILFDVSNPLIAYLSGISVALVILYVDDFHLKELE